ncbi:hypothetical protein Dimus_018253 [Dionaea muscipula]
MTSRKRKGKEVVGSTSFDSTRFTSIDNEAWFHAHENNTLIIEKSVSSYIDHLYQITEGFGSLRWAPILGLTGAYYPTLVREFYANMKEKEEKGNSTIHSWVRDKRIRMDVESLTEFLGVPNEGTRFQPEGFAVADERIYKFKEALLCLGLRVSCLNEVRVGDVYLTYKLAHGLQSRALISLANTLIREMQAMAASTLKGKGVCFPVLISSYLASQGVHLPAELRVSTSPHDVISEHHLFMFGYVRDGQGWRNNALIPPPSAAPEDPASTDMPARD